MTSFDHLLPFGVLVGTWRIEAHTSRHWDGTISGETTFQWFDDQAFLIQRSTMPPPFPTGLYVIGGREGGDQPGAGSGDTLAHYFDSRNVSRVFRTTLVDGGWTVWRDSPGFDQRYHGQLSNDESRVDGMWEMRNDAHWFVDFHLDHIRIG